MKRLTRHGLVWLAIAIVPAAINLMIWKIGVVPAREKLAQVREMASLVEIKPRLEGLVSQSDGLLSKLSQGVPVTGDVPSAVQWLQGLARAQRVKIEEIDKKEAEGPAAGQESVDLKMTGGYFRLVHWLNAMEKNPNLYVEHCSLGPSSVPGADDRMDLTVRILSKNP